MNERSIFLDALELTDPERRRKYLDQACGEDQGLRRQVEELLVSHNEASSFLEKPPEGLVATIATGDLDTVDDTAGEISLEFLAPSDKPGCLGSVGPYEVIEVIGRGGMGIVLRAYDTKLNRIVAIKVMAAELAANRMAVKRFLREARAAAAVCHDHVVTIHAIEEDNRPPFIVMEFVDGRSLQEKLDRDGALDLPQILRIGMQMARGLSAAHEQGLVHRDVKPANILLENGVERVKLTDFGLARAVDDVSVTQTGQIAGTPQFMSPEQAEGLAIDARSDLFSLGSVLYTMCTGRPPFRADNAVAMLRRVTDDDPRPIREVNAEIPDWLEAIIFKLLVKDPAERFQTAAQVAEMLGQHLAHLQHPCTAPKPASVEVQKPQQSSFDLDEELGSVESTLRIHGWIAIMWAVPAIIFALLVYAVPGNFTATFFRLNAPWALGTGVLSLISSLLAFVGMSHVRRRDSFGKAMVGSVAAMLPVNPVLVPAVPVSIWSMLKLRNPKLRSAFHPATFPTRSWPKVETASAITGCLALFLVAGIMIYVKTDNGTIRVELNDPNTTVTIDNEQRLSFQNSNNKGSLTVRAGEHKLHIEQGDLEFETEAFRVRRGHEVVLSVELIDGKLGARLKMPDSRSVAGGSVTTYNDRVIGMQGDSARPSDRQLGELEDRPDSDLPHIVQSDSIMEAQSLKGHTDVVGALAFLPNGKSLVSGSQKTIYLWDLATETVVREISIDSPVKGLAAHPDDRHVITSHEDGSITTWDLTDGRAVRRFTGHTDEVHDVAISTNGERLLSGGSDGLVRLWDTATGEPVRSFKQVDCTAVALSRDGRLAVHAGTSLVVRDVESGDTLRTLKRQGGSVSAMDLSPDGRFVLAGDYYGMIEIWQLATGRQMGRLKAHNAAIMGLSYTPDGRYFVSGSFDQTILVFDTVSSKFIARAKCDDHSTTFLAMGPDGQSLASGGGYWLKPKDNSPWEFTVYKDREFPIRRWRLPDGSVQSDSTKNSLGMTLRLIPAGEFEMGTADEDVAALSADENWFFADFVPDRRQAETPRHKVTISKPFEMSVHEVTVGQFRQFVEASNYKTTAEQDGAGYGWRNGEWQEGAAFNWRNPGFEQTDDHPVCNVSWEDAVAFCRWLSDKEGSMYRLPTEAEWEYACRAGTTTLFWSGDNVESLSRVANLADQSLRKQQPSVTWAAEWEDGFAATAAVGSFRPNAFGLQDMHGNVWEWCQDVYDDQWYQSSPDVDPVRRGSSRHVFRGGGFDNWPGFLRSADRYSSHSKTIVTHWAGFRVVREVAIDKAAGGGEDPAAHAFFRRFERTIQESDAASVIYEGHMTTTKNGVATATSYWGAYQAVPGGKTAFRPPGGGGGWQGGMQLTGVDTFYDPPPYDLLVNQITRSGFGESPHDMLARAYMWPVKDLRWAGAGADSAGCEVIAHKLQPTTDTVRDVKLWIDKQTLAPIRRTLHYESAGRTVSVAERYRGFNTDALDRFGILPPA